MSEMSQYNKVFVTILQVAPEALPGLEYQAVTAWDSIGHMQLMTELEEVFGVVFEMEDILDFSSYEKGKEILRKYGVKL